MAENTSNTYEVVYAQTNLDEINLLQTTHHLNINTAQTSSTIPKLEDILKQWNFYDELYNFLKGK